MVFAHGCFFSLQQLADLGKRKSISIAQTQELLLLDWQTANEMAKAEMSLFLEHDGLRITRLCSEEDLSNRLQRGFWMAHGAPTSINDFVRSHTAQPCEAFFLADLCEVVVAQGNLKDLQGNIFTVFS